MKRENLFQNTNNRQHFLLLDSSSHRVQWDAMGCRYLMSLAELRLQSRNKKTISLDGCQFVPYSYDFFYLSEPSGRQVYGLREDRRREQWLSCLWECNATFIFFTKRMHRFYVKLFQIGNKHTWKMYLMLFRKLFKHLLRLSSI